MSKAHCIVDSSAHSPSFQSLHLRRSSFWFSNLSVTSPTSLFILQTFRRFTYVTALSPTLPFFHLRHGSFSNSSFASPMWQVLDFCSFSNLCHFTYVTTYSPTLPSLYLRHSSFYNPSVASHTSQFILQLFFRFCYITSISLNSTGEPSLDSNGAHPASPCTNRYGYTTGVHQTKHAWMRIWNEGG